MNNKNSKNTRSNSLDENKEITSFLNWLRTKGRTIRTINIYSYFISRYNLHTFFNKTIEEFNSYLVSLNDTQSNKHFISSIMRRYYQFKGENYKKVIGIPFKSQERDITYSKEEIYRVLNECDDVLKTYLKILWESGLRRVSALYLSKEVVDLKTGKISVPEIFPGNKAKRKFVTFISKDTCDYIIYLINKYNENNRIPIGTDTPIFLKLFENKYKNKLKNKRLTNIEKEKIILCCIDNETIKMAVRAKISNPKHFLPHALRHSHATYFLESGGRIENLSYELGQSSTKMTERYTHKKEEMLREDRKKINF